MRFAGLALASGAALAVLGATPACDVGGNENSQALYGDASLVANPHTCPCEVDDDAGPIHFLACNSETCLTMGNERRGFRCETGGLVEEDSLCNDAGRVDHFDAGSPGEPPGCNTCAAIGSQCGSSQDACDDEEDCGTCPANQFCTEELSYLGGIPNVFRPWSCWPQAQQIAIYGNAEGGTLDIDVDVDIPNLAIGITARHEVNVTVTGQYKDDVLFAYFVGPAFPVFDGVTRSFIDVTGTPIPNGFCEAPAAGEGCLPSTYLSALFSEAVGAPILFNYCQDGAFSGTYRISEQGTCAY